jgi:hypothetical protein
MIGLEGEYSEEDNFEDVEMAADVEAITSKTEQISLLEGGGGVVEDQGRATDHQATRPPE